jgi:hypothetical protein
VISYLRVGIRSFFKKVIEGFSKTKLILVIFLQSSVHLGKFLSMV